MSIEKQQGMEVLGVDLSPCVSIKDRTIVGAFLTRLNACLSLSWLDNSFRPQSRVAQLRLGPTLLECTLWMVERMCGERINRPWASMT